MFRELIFSEIHHTCGRYFLFKECHLVYTAKEEFLPKFQLKFTFPYTHHELYKLKSMNYNSEASWKTLQSEYMRHGEVNYDRCEILRKIFVPFDNIIH